MPKLPDRELIAYFKKIGEPENVSMGKLLVTDGKIPEYVYFVEDGEVRQITRMQGDEKGFTLGIHSAPFFAGLSAAQARKGIEFVTAARDCRLVRITRESLINAAAENSKAAEYLEDWLSPADLWPLLEGQDNLHLPENPKELRTWIKRLCNLSNSRWVADCTIGNTSLDESKRWFLAEGGISGFRYGELITNETLNTITIQESRSIRLIGIPKSLWLENNKEPALLPVGNKETEINRPTADANEKQDQLGANLNEDVRDEDYRFFGSTKGVIPETIACFQTFSYILRLPLKIDLLKRVLTEQVERGNGGISLQVCGAIAESMGLQTQLIHVPLDLIGRLKVPSLVRFLDGELCVALATKEDGILLSRPTAGIEPLSIEELGPLCNEDKTVSVLVLQKTDRTPEKRFGLSWFVPAIKRNKKPLLEVLIASLFVQLFQLMNPLIVQQIIDKVIGKNGMSTLPVLAVLLFSFSVFENVLTAVRTNLFIDTTNRIDITLGEQVIDHLLRLPMNYFDRRPVGELSTRIGELEQIRSFLTGTALTVVMDSIFSIIYIVVMMFYSWILTIVALLVAPLLGILTFSTSPIIRGQLRAKAELNAKTQNHLVEVLTGIQTVKAQNFELKARWRWKERYSDYVAEGYKNAVTATARNGLTQFLNQVSTLSILCVGAYLVIKGELTLGQLIAFRIIAGYVTGPLLRLSNLYQSFQQASISLERLSDIIDTPQESTDLDKKNIPLSTIKGKVEYEDVSFRFRKDGPLQLSQVDLTIQEGEFVAIVGQSGSGKSTLTKLLPRLYSPNSGRILIDGTDISKVELYSLRRQIGIVPQDSLLFEGSVHDNIALSNPEATSEEIIAAARVACAHDFIMTLPSGYASSVGERGGGLSGGQRQRVAIARTVLQSPRLLIMDEATSALDYQTERLVSLNLMEHFRGKTVLFITHRLSSIIHADRIIMMHQGHIEEQGSHEDLMEMRGRYYALFRQQEASF